jgi:hypothetical protein
MEPVVVLAALADAPEACPTFAVVDLKGTTTPVDRIRTTPAMVTTAGGRQ